MIDLVLYFVLVFCGLGALIVLPWMAYTIWKITKEVGKDD